MNACDSCKHVHQSVHTGTLPRTRTRAHTRARAHAHAHGLSYAHIQACTHTRVRAHTQARAHTEGLFHAMHARTPVRTLKYAYVRTQACACTHAQERSVSRDQQAHGTDTESKLFCVGTASQRARVKLCGPKTGNCTVVIASPRLVPQALLAPPWQLG